MPRKGEDRENAGRPAELDTARELARAYREIAALPEGERQRLYTLVRAASDVPLSETETQQIAAILWADRGPGLLTSLEAGFKLFHSADEDATRPPKRRRRSITSLSAQERQALLASLLANRHVPPQSPPHNP
ncbi:MAG: hypothetical protein KatS3mg060_2979 [Dehalococcoidia bacterium]|nr:MAG: hypothetical protein KatS3mg060_2979 [Dehalococcoidia bacterium]